MVVPLISIILLAPLIAFAIFALFGLANRSFTRQDYLSTAAMLVALVCSLLLLREVVPKPEPCSSCFGSVGMDRRMRKLGLWLQFVCLVIVCRLLSLTMTSCP